MQPFVMERWQSHYENTVRYNLSESGVHPLSLAELLELAGGPEAHGRVSLGYGQTNGTIELRERIAALYDGATADQVVVTNGSAEANFVTAWQLLRPGDVTAVLTPTYMQLPGLAAEFGGSVRPIPLQEDRRWQPDPERLEAAIHGSRLVVVTNPQNPTGARLTEETIAGILRAADIEGAWVLADEVYRGAERDAADTPSLFGRHPRVVATGSLSKAYGLPGLRIGWVVAPESMAEALWGRKDYTTIGPGALTDHLAALALRDDVRSHLIDRTRAIVRDHYEVVRQWVETVESFRLTRHEAGAVCLARYELPIPSLELVERLRSEQDVLIVPGAHFDLESYVRIGFGIEREDLEAALERVSNLVHAL